MFRTNFVYKPKIIFAMAKYLNGVLGQMCWLAENHDRWLNLTEIFVFFYSFIFYFLPFCSNKLAAKMSLTL